MKRSYKEMRDYSNLYVIVKSRAGRILI